MEKDKYQVISLIYGNLKKWYKWTYIQDRNRPTDKEKDLWLPKGKEVGRESLGLTDIHCYI